MSQDSRRIAKEIAERVKRMNEREEFLRDLEQLEEEAGGVFAVNPDYLKKENKKKKM